MQNQKVKISTATKGKLNKIKKANELGDFASYEDIIKELIKLYEYINQVEL